MKLEIELIPKTSFFKNLRSELSTSEWNILRKDCYKKAGYKCEICGGKGKKHPVECHELWEYKNGIQKLVGLIALCPPCHEVKHFGRTGIMGRYEQAILHLKKVNQWTDKKVRMHIEGAFALWAQRSVQKWSLDISWAKNKESNMRVKVA